MTREHPPVASSSLDAEVTVRCRLPTEFPERPTLENAIRSALGALGGRWDAVVEVQGGVVLAVALVAPDGSAWTVSCCDPEHRRPESIADTVRAACSRRRWLAPHGEPGESFEARSCAAARPTESLAREDRGGSHT